MSKLHQMLIRLQDAVLLAEFLATCLNFLQIERIGCLNFFQILQAEILAGCLNFHSDWTEFLAELLGQFFRQLLAEIQAMAEKIGRIRPIKRTRVLTKSKQNNLVNLWWTKTNQMDDEPQKRRRRRKMIERPIIQFRNFGPNKRCFSTKTTSLLLDKSCLVVFTALELPVSESNPL